MDNRESTVSRTGLSTKRADSYAGCVAMKLPIHGFVLAGGLSSRMGRDKAMIDFCGRPMIAIAVETLEATCELVSIAGNRSELAEFGPVISDQRSGEGPASGIEAGMLACASEWALFVPVDLPLLSPGFVRTWAEAVLARLGTRASYAQVGSDPHPALCLLRRDCATDLVAKIYGGDRRLQSLLGSLEGLWIADALELAGGEDPSQWFMNVNTPEDLIRAERLYEDSGKPVRRERS
jgi:molybdopterin-guanine dinucleotide biosynthesis protein A